MININEASFRLNENMEALKHNFLLRGYFRKQEKAKLKETEKSRIIKNGVAKDKIMITVEKYGVILSPTEREFENNGVLNPGIYQEGNTIHILYRAVQSGNFSTIGYAKTDGPLKIIERKEQPLIIRDFDYEKQWCGRCQEL